jgi:uncharacterized protein (DUF433 family)
MRDTDLFFGSEQDYQEFERRMFARTDVSCKRYPPETRPGFNAFIGVSRKLDGHGYDPCNWFYGSLDEHIDTVDWLHNALACDMHGEPMFRADVLDAVVHKKLICGPKVHIINTKLHVERMYGYLSDGWSISSDLFHEKVKLTPGVCGGKLSIKLT